MFASTCISVRVEIECICVCLSMKIVNVKPAYWSGELSVRLMVRKTWVQSQVASYQRLLKWYMMPLYFTLSNIRYVSRVKWSNPGKGVAPPYTSVK